MSWKSRTRIAQFGRCIICDKPCDPTFGTLDHFIPAVMLRGTPLWRARIGLSFWSHQKCNSLRGHACPDAELMARALDVIGRMNDGDRAAALENWRRAAEQHAVYVKLSVAMVSRISATREAANGGVQEVQAGADRGAPSVGAGGGYVEGERLGGGS